MLLSNCGLLNLSMRSFDGSRLGFLFALKRPSLASGNLDGRRLINSKIRGLLMLPFRILGKFIIIAFLPGFSSLNREIYWLLNSTNDECDFLGCYSNIILIIVNFKI